VPVQELFILVALMLYDAEAAVVTAALVSVCAALRTSKSGSSVACKFAVTIVSTALSPAFSDSLTGLSPRSGAKDSRCNSPTGSASR
jgi:hypothetical protein